MKNEPKKIEVESKRMDKELFEDSGGQNETWRIFQIMSEFVTGFELLRKYKKAATFFGSSRSGLKPKEYKDAEDLAGQLAQDGYAIITGGASGIMEFANKGAFKAGGDSVGINIELPEEQTINKYVKDSANFHHFFTRKVMLAFASQVYIFFPGGFGTLDEFFELVTLVQTKKIKPIPLILVGRDYWQPLQDFLKKTVYKDHQAISQEDFNLYHIVDNADEAYKLIKSILKIKK